MTTLLNTWFDELHVKKDDEVEETLPEQRRGHYTQANINTKLAVFENIESIYYLRLF